MSKIKSVVSVGVSLALFGCGPEDKQIVIAVPVPSGAIVSPPPPPPPPASGQATSSTLGTWMPSPTITGMPGIPSGFDFGLGLQKTWGSGEIPKSAAPDVVGAFRMVCGASALKYIDPIVYPGKVGESHLHQFYGLKDVQPNETYESARGMDRSSSCGVDDYSLNRSAYWLPALLDGKGNVLQPDLVTIYYKRRPKTDPKCSWSTDPKGEGEECVNMPQGLRMIAGFNMLDAASSASIKTRGVSFECGGLSADNLEAVLPACLGDTKLKVVMDFPACWDGRHLDSPDHRAHVTYPSYGTWGFPKCPATHPKIIPALHVAGEYSLIASDDRTLLQLSSDTMPGLPRGKSLHGDALIAWDPDAWKMFHENCIDKLLNCSGGDLGNGLQLKGANQPSYGWRNPNRLVPMPARP